jgi:hypothetical protein
MEDSATRAAFRRYVRNWRVKLHRGAITVNGKTIGLATATPVLESRVIRERANPREYAGAGCRARQSIEPNGR